MKIDIFISIATFIMWAVFIFYPDPILRIFLGVGVGWTTVRLFLKTLIEDKYLRYKFKIHNRGDTTGYIQEQLELESRKGWQVISFQKDVDGSWIILLKKE